MIITFINPQTAILTDKNIEMREIKLISMTDFVNKELKFRKSKHYEYDSYDNDKALSVIESYANFLKQPLTLGMFVPCDEDGNVLNDPCKHNTYCVDFCQGRCQEDYDEAKERVLFKNITIQLSQSWIDFYNGILVYELDANKPIEKMFSHVFRNHGKSENIETLTRYDLELTESAIKSLGL